MTTDKTPATLATVKHGGCVQLAASERARFEAWHCEKFKTRWQTGAPTRDLHNGVYADNYGPAEQQERWELWQAATALSAQPSPGGQDALVTELTAHAAGLERMAADDRETGLSIEQAIEDGEGYTPDEATDVAAGLQHDAERGEETAALLRKAAATLGARQPVAVRVTPEMRAAFRKAYREGGFWADRLDTALDAMMRAAPPAQAVDLVELREAIRKAWQKSAASGNIDLEFGKLLAMIDSQAVGNG
ncbi:hypothetical protein [Stenotrophomonas sp. YIM B13575]|uniref:hypothetical protein n=1 Tax=Stenotrophomonas sp. YIM B13575 TaxID=3366314 RepID=UPI0036768FEA